MKDIVQQLAWFLCQWWFWIAYITSLVLFWYLFKQRTYTKVNGKAFVRHGRLGKWIDLEEHLRQKHPELKN